MANSEITGLISGSKTVTTAGTAVVLSTAQRVQSVAIIAKVANTGKIYIGGSDVASTTNEGMDPGVSVSITLNKPFDINTVYIDSSVDGEGVDFYAVKV